MAIHVFVLALLHERVVDAVSRFIARRHLTAMFAAVTGIAVVLVAILHAFEAWVWAGANRLLGALPDLASSVLFSVGAMTTAAARSICNRIGGRWARSKR
jgi:hypothetical protein